MLTGFEMGAWDSFFKEANKIIVDLSDFNVVKGADKKYQLTLSDSVFLSGQFTANFRGCGYSIKLPRG